MSRESIFPKLVSKGSSNGKRIKRISTPSTLMAVARVACGSKMLEERCMAREKIARSLCFVLTAATASAQTTISTIEGTIKDAQGSVVAGAHVVVKSQSLGIERTATSDANGFYRVTALPAGNYTLTISHTGFAPRTFDNVELTVNRTLTLDIPL